MRPVPPPLCTSVAATAIKKDTLSGEVAAAYGFFLVVAGAVYHFVAEGEFSAVMTMAVIFQCLAMALLCLQTLSSGSAAGISARALGLEALSLGCRLSSTLWLNGYLPVDASGDWIFQAVDVTTLALVLVLLRQVLVVERRTYASEHDTLPIAPMTLGCLVGAVVLHADMNSRPLFDALWMAGLFIGVVAVLPQLWLISRHGGRVEALTSHFIAMMAVSRALSGVFVWHARFDITCEPWVAGVNHAVWAILAAHLVHLLLLADFMYYYVRSVITAGLSCCMDIDMV